MKLNILLMIFLFSFLACDTVEEEFLYDKDDPEYVWAQEAAAAECVADADIFPYLDAAGDFVNSGQLGKIYKVSQDTASATVLYMKIISSSATEIEIQVNSSDSSYDKVVTFEKSDHDSLFSELKILSCNLNYKTFFTAGGLGNTTSMTLAWKKETIGIADDDDSDTEPETYDRRTDTYTFSKDLPLFFFFYNGKKVANRILNDGEEEKEATSTITITDVTTENECNTSLTVDEGFNSNCDFSTISGFDTCDVTINTGMYATNAYGDELMSLSGTGGCESLRSAAI